MARYGQKFKDNAVARLLPPQSCPVETLSARIGISVGMLERWRAEALANASGNSGGGDASRSHQKSNARHNGALRAQ